MKKIMQGGVSLFILLLPSFVACNKLADDKQTGLQQPAAITEKMMLENCDNPDEH